MLLLGLYLIASGIIPLLSLSFASMGIVLAGLAIATGPQPVTPTICRTHYLFTTRKRRHDSIELDVDVGGLAGGYRV
jgi:hypothetical protein